MPRSIKETSITIGFVQVPVALFKAGQDDTLDLKSLCECGHPPQQFIVCKNPGCGTKAFTDQDVRDDIGNGQVVLQGPDGAFAARRYASWQATPKRGYEWTKGKYVELTADEMKAARSSVKYDTFEVVKTADFKDVATRYVLGDPLYVLPPEDGNTVTKKAYSLVTEALDQKGMALLAKLTVREKSYRYAIVADKAANVMMAYVLSERRPLPYTPEKQSVTAAETGQVQGILQGVYSTDALMDPLPDPLLDLLQEKIAATQRLPGIGQPILVPK